MDDADRMAHPTKIEAFRWLVAGMIFLLLNTALLFVLVHWLGFRVSLATLASAETCTLLRYFLNELWVFDSAQFSWKRLWHYHVANGGAFVIWWLATNLLTAAGLNYIAASIVAVMFSTGFSFLSNFYWVWRKKHPRI